MKKIITSPQAPAPIGPYNQAVLFKDTLYVSGQIAINPKTNNLETTSLEVETEQVMKNLEAILKAAKMSFDEVVKCSIFIKNMQNFDKINSIYGRYFDERTAPARETVEVAGLPKNVNVEISLIAIR